MSVPSSSHRPRFLNDASLEATTPSMALLSAVLLVVVSGIAYSIVNNSKSKYPLANPPRWCQTSLSKRVEFVMEGQRIFNEAKKRYGNKPYRLLTEMGESLIISTEQFTRLHSEKRLSFADTVNIDFHGDLPGFTPYKMVAHEKMLVQNPIRKRLTKSLSGLVEPLSIETALAAKTIFGESSVLNLYREASRIIGPVIERRRQLKEEAIRKGESAPVYDDAIEWAEIESKGSPYDPRDVQLLLSFAAIHTTTSLLARTMSELSSKPKFIAALRQEIVEVCKAEGLTHAALTKMKLLDSSLKEALRIVPGSTLGSRRVATDDFVTPDGIEFKKGDRIFVDNTKVIDPNVHPEPAKYDIYRYYNMRDDPITAAKAQLVGTTVENLAFGFGIHACPGRFFAADETKLALCHLLLKYDWELCPGSNLEGYLLVSTLFGLDPNVKIRYRSCKPELDLDNL